MMQYIIIAALIAIIYFLYFKKKPQKVHNQKSKEKTEKYESNDMIECNKCGVYSELGESILSNGKYYCSTECADEAK